MSDFLLSIKTGFVDNFIVEKRYLLIFEGLRSTLLLSVIAGIVGVIIGVLLAMGKLSNKKILNRISNIYIDIIRGTPSFTQLLVIYFVVFGSVNIPKILAGGLAFGINSGAYVAEIIRAGILSVDYGQTEAGRSLGLNERQTMQHIIFPQAIKNILPALANEFIVLIKETAVVGYIAVMDITKAAQIIMSRTLNAKWPLLGSAVIYYIIIKLLTIMFAKLEKRMRRSDAR